MEFFVILTLVVPNGEMLTLSLTVDGYDGITRRDVYRIVRDELVIRYGDNAAKANVIFYSAEPNTKWSQER